MASKISIRDKVLINKAMKKIQAYNNAEGSISKELLTSFLSGTPLNAVDGTLNNYKTYNAQVMETYRKYNGKASWGCQQTRAIVDLRTSFIAKEGLSISTTDKTFREWVKLFLKESRIGGTEFYNMVLGGEITGKALLYLKKRPGELPKVIRLPYGIDNAWNVEAKDNFDITSVNKVYIENKLGKKEYLPITDFIYIKTGGDDISLNNTTTRVGIVLSDIENYDRALKDIRLLNHVTARVTPTFKTESAQESNEVLQKIKNTRWKIGRAWVGTAKLDYATPGVGAHENLKTEMASVIKTISSTTGIPVHWIGWTDLMSNRSTAETLYDTIKNATSRERQIYAEGMRDLIVKAQELYIDSGGTLISRVYKDFDVRIPVIDYAQFTAIVSSLSTAYGDEVISKSDYQNMLPIDPLLTEEQLEKEKEKDLDNFMKKGDNYVEEN